MDDFGHEQIALEVSLCLLLSYGQLFVMVFGTLSWFAVRFGHFNLEKLAWPQLRLGRLLFKTSRSGKVGISEYTIPKLMIWTPDLCALDLI